MGLTTLIIGYGNTLRGDDGVGYRIAEIFEQEEDGLESHYSEESRHTVRSHPCHQLTPDLAAELAQADRVIFVDAIAPGSYSLSQSDLECQSTFQMPVDRSVQTAVDPLVQILRLAPTDAADRAIAPGLAHGLMPQTLLDLTHLLYNHIPETYWILIPSVSFDFCETYSDLTQQGMAIALNHIRSLCLLDSKSF